jgi:hypothetical protein
MHLVVLLLFSLTGVGVVAALAAALYAALAAALYAALPRHFLECAELHGRFHGLSQEEAVSDGTPTEALPDGDASNGQLALGH